MNIWLSQCIDFEHLLKPDDGHTGLKHVVRKKTVNCECVKVTDKNQQITQNLELHSWAEHLNVGFPFTSVIY
jgi:hypothetical protein